MGRGARRTETPALASSVRVWHTPRVLAFVLPALLLVAVFATASRAIDYLRQTGQRVADISGDWERLEDLSRQMATFRVRLGPPEDVYDIRLSSDELEVLWARQRVALDAELTTFDTGIPDMLLPPADRERLESLRRVWSLTEQDLDGLATVYRNLKGTPLGLHLAAVSLADAVTGEADGRAGDEGTYAADLWRFYRLRDVQTDLDVSGRMLTRQFEELSRSIAARVDQLTRLIEWGAALSSLCIVLAGAVLVQRSYRASQENETKYRALFTEAHEGILLLDLDRERIVEGNVAFQELVGRPLRQIVGRPPSDLHGRDQDASGRQLLADLHQRGAAAAALSFLRPDGRAVPVEISARLVRLGGRRLVLCIVRDTSERVRAEAARREMEARVRQVQKLESLGLSPAASPTTSTTCSSASWATPTWRSAACPRARRCGPSSPTSRPPRNAPPTSAGRCWPTPAAAASSSPASTSTSWSRR